MKRMKWLGAVALTALVGVAACDREGQNDAALADSAEEGFMQMDPEMMAVMMEMQEIQQQLAPIQEEALQDEQLAGQLQALSDRIHAAMESEDPDLVQRIEGFQARVAEAESTGDQEGMQVLMMEAQGLQSEADALQMAILERPDIKAEIEAFEAAHRARMIEIDPAAAGLLDRIDEILAGLEG